MEYAELSKTPAFDEAIVSGQITNVDDIETNRATLTLFKTSKGRTPISQLHQVVKENGWSLNISQGQSVSAKNIKRLPRALYEYGI
eukprot:4979308-Karenia_brevis.AAC.1